MAGSTGWFKILGQLSSMCSQQDGSKFSADFLKCVFSRLIQTFCQIQYLCFQQFLLTSIGDYQLIVSFRMRIDDHPLYVETKIVLVHRNRTVSILHAVTSAMHDAIF
jgi:hypothetical protein